MLLSLAIMEPTVACSRMPGLEWMEIGRPARRRAERRRDAQLNRQASLEEAAWLSRYPNALDQLLEISIKWSWEDWGDWIGKRTPTAMKLSSRVGRLSIESSYREACLQ